MGTSNRDGDPPGIQTVTCLNAADFLKALHPMRGEWEDSEAVSWVYRGHGDSDWQLLPKAFRKGVWVAFLDIEGFEPRPGGVEEQERLVTGRFYRRLDRAGLPIPNGRGLVLLRVPADVIGSDLAPAV
jgi:hypothetical protein